MFGAQRYTYVLSVVDYNYWFPVFFCLVAYKLWQCFCVIDAETHPCCTLLSDGKHTHSYSILSGPICV